ncbi:PAS domain-containing protein [Leptolyngbya sp. AN02str]|uniref:PAS domain-containing protein n=1 Tax=Leptolyngbya sp. AN02str TaxID=3423363 RepID=UPI003D31E053
MITIRRFLTYGVAIGVTVIALLLTLWLETILAQTTGVFFYMAIAITTWYGGRRPGIVAVVLSALALNYYFIPPTRQIRISSFSEFLWLFFVLGVGLIINVLTASLQESKRIAAERKQLLQQEQAARSEVEVLLQQLKVERYQLEQILQQMPVGVAIAEAPSGKLLFHNVEAGRLLRHPLIDSDTYQDYVRYGAIHADGPSYQPDEYPIARSLLSGEVVKAKEMYYRREDGTTTVFSVSATPILDQDGQVVSTVSTFEDISDRKIAQRNEQFLSDLDLQLRQLSDTDAMVWEAISRIGEYLNVERCVWHEVNVQEDLAIVTQDWRRDPTISSVVGVTRLSESILPDMITQFHAGQPAVVPDVATHPYTAPFAQNFAEQDIRAFVGIPCLYEGHWVAVLAINARTAQEWRPDQVALLQKVVARLWSTIEHTRAVQVLQEQEERTRLATEAADLGMWFWNIRQNELVWTDRCKTLFGIAPDVPISYEAFLNALHPDDRDFTQAAVTHALEQKVDYNIEYRTVWPDNSIHWIAARGKAFYDTNGQPIRMVGTAQDISDRKEATERVRASEERFQRLVANVPGAIYQYVVHPDGSDELAYISPQCREIYEYEPETLQQNFSLAWQIVHPEDVERVNAAVAASAENLELLNIEFRLLPASGTLRWVQTSSTPTRLSNGDTTWDGIVTDVTDRKQSEASILQLNQELQRRVTELQTLLDVIPIGIGIAEDPDCRHIRVNPAFADALGIPPTVNASLSAPEEERPTSFKVYQNGRELAPEELPLQYAAAHGVEIRDLEVDVVWQDGTTVTLLEYAAPLLDESGQPRGSIGAFLNITDRKRAELALRNSGQQLTLALHAAKAGAWTWELATNDLYWSDEYYRVFGLEPGSLEPSYENGFSRLHPDDRGWVEQETTEAIAQGKNINVEYRILLPDGSLRWVNGLGQMFYDELSQSARMAGIVMDITERKQAEAALRASQERYRTLAQNFPNGAVFLFDHDLRYVLAEGQGLAHAGMDRTSLEGKTIWEVLDPQTCQLLEPLYRAALSGDSETLEIPFGDRTYCLHCLPVYDDQGFVPLGMLMTQDITWQKQAEQVLRTARDELERQVQQRTQELRETNVLLAQREQEFRTLVENTPDVITRHDRQHHCLYINPACIQSLGMPPEFFLGKTPSELGYPEDLAQFWETSLETVFSEGKVRIDEFSVMNGDELRSYQVYVVPERGVDHSIVSVMTIGRDITSLRQAEKSARKLAEELQRSNQELEQFAYVASHDLQEPLRAITSFTQLLAQDYKEQLDGDADMYIEFIVDGATRMQQLIRDLLTYSRVGRYELQLQPVDCNALLERVKNDLQVAIAENQATITADLLPTITADPNQMKNLLQNLIGNSLKYRSEANPQIHISVRSHIVEDTDDFSHTGSSHLRIGAEEWLFSIQDNGIGIEPRYAERIFGIFQRLHTSDEYSGTGLGLAICQKIIERHQGQIWVESRLGQGATFFFTIPLSIRTQDGNPRSVT